MAITMTPQTATIMDLATVRQLVALQATCPKSITITVEYQHDQYLISYMFKGGDTRYTARETCREVLDACELIIMVMLTLKEDMI